MSSIKCTYCYVMLCMCARRNVCSENNIQDASTINYDEYWWIMNIFTIANVLQNVSMDALANLSQNVSAWLGNCCRWWLANSNPIYGKLQKSVASFYIFLLLRDVETITAAYDLCLKNRVFHNKPLSATWRTPETSWPLHLPNAAPSPGPRRNIHHTENW